MSKIASYAGFTLFLIGYVAGSKFFGHEYLIVAQAIGMLWAFATLYNINNALRKSGVQLDWKGQEIQRRG